MCNMRRNTQHGQTLWKSFSHINITSCTLFMHTSKSSEMVKTVYIYTSQYITARFMVYIVFLYIYTTMGFYRLFFALYIILICDRCRDVNIIIIICVYVTDNIKDLSAQISSAVYVCCNICLCRTKGGAKSEEKEFSVKSWRFILIIVGAWGKLEERR